MDWVPPGGKRRIVDMDGRDTGPLPEVEHQRAQQCGGCGEAENFGTLIGNGAWNDLS